MARSGARVAALLCACLGPGCHGSDRTTASPDATAPLARVQPATSGSASPVASIAPPQASGAAARPPGRVVHARFHSAALGVDKALEIWLPGGYDGDARRWPVIYLLHGLGGAETNWITHGKLPAAADALGLEAIVAMPDGDDGFYVDWPRPVSLSACLAEKPPFDPAEPPATYCVQQARYETYVVKDVVGFVDATYRTRAERAGRAITGLSMGGFGALSLAMRHKDVFSSAASHSGLASLLYAGPWPYEKGKARLAANVGEWGSKLKPALRQHVIGIFGGDVGTWRAFDPSVLAAGLHDADLAIYLDCGTEDGFRFQDGLQYLHEVLDGAGVPHEVHLVKGDHDFSLWKERIRESLAFHAARFQATR